MTTSAHSGMSLSSTKAQTGVITLQKLTGPTHCCLLCVSCRAHLPCQSSKDTQRDAGNALPDEVHILAVAVLCEHLLGMSHGIGASCHGVTPGVVPPTAEPAQHQHLYKGCARQAAANSGNVHRKCQLSLKVRAACSGSGTTVLLKTMHACCRAPAQLTAYAMPHT